MCNPKGAALQLDFEQLRFWFLEKKPLLQAEEVMVVKKWWLTNWVKKLKFEREASNEMQV